MKGCLFYGQIGSLAGLALIVLLAADPVLGQTPVFKLDFDSSNDSISTSVIDPPPTMDAANSTFTVTLVLTGATKLMGANCDLVFNPDHLRVVNIQESSGDVNFDGRANVFDIREVGKRLNTTAGSELYDSYFDRVEGEADGVIDMADVGDIEKFFAKPGIFWTVNTNDTTIRESVEVFEDPTLSNENGVIDDIASTLLPRDHLPAPGYPEEQDATFAGPPGFGFNGDARIAEITFRPVNGFVGETELSLTEPFAVIEETVFVLELTDGQLRPVMNNTIEPGVESVNITVQ